MAVSFNKPKGLKYTDMCIYIDKNMPLVLNPGEFPKIEALIYEYIYHIVYALAYKKCYFKEFADYDGFALYVASNLFLNMRNRYQHAGEIRRGKEVKPVKSVLNYIKAILFPMRVAYQNQFFRMEIDPQVGQDTSKLESIVKESVRAKYNEDFGACFKDSLSNLPKLIGYVIKTTPYRRDRLLFRRLYISCYLSLLNQVTFANKVQKKLLKRVNSNKDGDRGEYAIKSYYYKNHLDKDSIILWHLDESFHDYVFVLVRRIKETFSKNLSDDYHAGDIHENEIDIILNSAFDTLVSNSEEE